MSLGRSSARILCCVISVMLLLFQTASAMAQSPQPAAGSNQQADQPVQMPSAELVERLKDVVVEQDAQVNELKRQLAKSELASGLSDEDRKKLLDAMLQTNLEYYKTLQANYESRQRLAAYRATAFEWHEKASNWILVLVIATTFAGILFSGYELYVSSRLPYTRTTEKPGQSDGQAATSGTTSIDLSLTALKVSTAVIGIVVLCISMVFLYMFLDKVYGIEIVSQVPKATPALAQSAASPE